MASYLKPQIEFIEPGTKSSCLLKTVGVVNIKIINSLTKIRSTSSIHVVTCAFYYSSQVLCDSTCIHSIRWSTSNSNSWKGSRSTLKCKIERSRHYMYYVYTLVVVLRCRHSLSFLCMTYVTDPLKSCKTSTCFVDQLIPIPLVMNSSTMN